MDWKEYETLAKKLASSSDEASQRSAISRAYYAVFNLSKERCVRHSVNIPPPANNVGSHEVVWNTLKETNDKNWRHIAVTGDRMKSNRRKADYDKSLKNNLQILLKQTLQDAAQCIKMLDGHFP